MVELKILQKTQELYEARWWEPEANRRVHCYLCPRHCHIHPGQSGFCFIRINQNGKLYNLGYGSPAALQIDPIEKKPLNHFLPGTRIFSMGTAGCNMGCFFCQNWDISKSRSDQVHSQDVPPEDVPLLALRYGCESISFTYQAFHDIYDHIDAVNVDLTAFTENFYGKITLTHLQPVLDTLKWLKKETNVWFEITNLMIPTLNDDPMETRRLAEWISTHLGPDVPLHFTAFHPDFRLQDKPRTPAATLDQARQIALDAGLHYVYEGNIYSDGSNTYCPKCKALLVRRLWHDVVEYRVHDGACPKCKFPIPGVWSNDAKENRQLRCGAAAATRRYIHLNL